MGPQARRQGRGNRKIFLAAIGTIGLLVVTYHLWSIGLRNEYEQDSTRSLQTRPQSLRVSKLVVVDEQSRRSSDTAERWQARRDQVKLAVQETWKVYETHAMGMDELAPISLGAKSNFGNMGATLVDALDTLWMLGLKDEFQRARDWIATSLNFEGHYRISLFETTIRIVGGLLSAYDLSADQLFLDKAKIIADKLMPAFDVTSSGIPINWIFLDWGLLDFQQNAKDSNSFALAEFGSIQLEYLTLSHRLNASLYANKTEPLLRRLNQLYPDMGMHPVWFNPEMKPYGGPIWTIGAMADSFYEYLVKLWLLCDKQDDTYRGMWERATDDILSKLLSTDTAGLSYVGQQPHKQKLSPSMEHLACYFPGNMALGVMQGAVTGSKAHQYLEHAANLTFTCWQMYNKTSTGLAPDITKYSIPDSGMPTVSAFSVSNLLRPETVESLFYMWRATKEEKYREWGWSIFESFQHHSRTPEGAYASVSNVNLIPAEHFDSMESFWLSETLKYLWLLFSEDSLLSLSEMVLNTEAHPFRVLKHAT